MKRRTPPKLLGERAECAFLNEAIQRGFTVSKPFGDSAPYDFIVNPNPHARNGRVWKVQVKCVTHAYDGSGYRVHTDHMRHGRRQSLAPHEADFIAAYLAPLNSWYIVPTHACKNRVTLRFYPSGRLRRRPGFETYLNAWHLLRAPRLPPGGSGWRGTSRLCVGKMTNRIN